MNKKLKKLLRKRDKREAVIQKAYGKWKPPLLISYFVLSITYLITYSYPKEHWSYYIFTFFFVFILFHIMYYKHTYELAVAKLKRRGAKVHEIKHEVVY